MSNDLQASHCYAPDSEQEFTLEGGLYHDYLLCLLKAEALWKAGLPAIYHLQSKSYYSCMLALFKVGSALAIQSLQQYQPGLSANEYKDLVKATDNDQQTRSKKRQSVRDPEESSRVFAAAEETNLLASTKVDTNAASAARATRGRGRGRGNGRDLQRRAAESGSVQKRQKTQSQAAAAVSPLQSQAAAEVRSAAKVEDPGLGPDGDELMDPGPIPMMIFSSDESDDYVEAESPLDDTVDQSNQSIPFELPDIGEKFQDDGPQGGKTEMDVEVNAVTGAGAVLNVTNSTSTGGGSSSQPGEGFHNILSDPFASGAAGSDTDGRGPGPGPESSTAVFAAASSSSRPSGPDERLAEAPGPALPEVAPPPAPVAPVVRGREHEPSSIMNLSTVWIANDIPIVKRSDKGTEPWFH